MRNKESAQDNSGDTISEFAAALTRTGNCPDWPGKLMAFSTESPNLSCEAVGLKVVTDLVEAADSSSSVFKTYLANFVQALFAIAKASEDKDSVREMAVEMLLCIVEEEDLRTCLNIKEFASELARILLELKLKVKDDRDLTDKKDAEKDGDTPRGLSEKGLNRLASEIGGENVKTMIFGYVSGYLKGDERRYKLAALMAISETAAHLPEAGIEFLLEEIVKLLKVQLNDPHQRVRLATCKAITALAGKYQPLFYEDYAKVILPLFVDKFVDPSSVVRANAIAAFKVIAKEEVEAAMPFADQSVKDFLEHVKPENPTKRREQCIDVIATVARLMGKKFMKYYSTVVPVIKGVIVAPSIVEEDTVPGKAIECFNFISESVEDEMVQADAHEVMQALMHIVEGLETADLLKDLIQETFVQMCRTLKGEFVPYLPQVIPNLLRVLDIEPRSVTYEDAAEVMAYAADNKGTELPSLVEVFDLVMKKRVARKIMGVIEWLSTYIKVLGSQLGEHLVAIAEFLLQLLSRGDDVMIKALPVIAEAFTAARESSDPATRKMLRVWVATVLEKVFKDLIPGDNDASITDSELMIALTKALYLSSCLRSAGQDVLNAQQVEDICEKVLRFIKVSNQRRASPEIRKMDPDQVLHSSLFAFIGVVMSFHADLYLQAGAESCRKFIETHLDPNCIPDDRAMALYVFASVLEHLKDKGATLWPTLAVRLVECIGDPDPGVRGAAAYGVIQAAKCPQFPAELIQKAATELFAFLSAKQSQKKAVLSATYKMIAALGTIVVHRKSCLQPSPEQFLNLWISNLPLKGNRIEALRTHSDLVDLLVQMSPEVLGPQNVNLPNLAAICASIYQTNFTTKKIDEGIKDFMQKIGSGEISSVGANFDEKLQKGIKRICQDSQS